jgi:hypothetical protein
MQNKSMNIKEFNDIYNYSMLSIALEALANVDIDSKQFEDAVERLYMVKDEIYSKIKVGK